MPYALRLLGQGGSPGPQKSPFAKFDGNRYCVPHRFVGGRLTVKADSSSVTIYHRYQEIVGHARSWRRGQTFGAERGERKLAEQLRRLATRGRRNASSISCTVSAPRCGRRYCAYVTRRAIFCASFGKCCARYCAGRWNTARSAAENRETQDIAPAAP